MIINPLPYLNVRYNTRMAKDPRYWHSRGFLPHFDADGFTQFVTFRLADSLPQTVLSNWRLELDRDEISDVDLRRRIEYYLDQNFGTGSLRITAIADCLEQTLLKWDGVKYRLISWVIMPNHGHILISPIIGNRLSDIMHSIKSFTAHEANRVLGRRGPFWAKEYFDRYIRNQKHFANTVKYIEENPVKARLCKLPEDWRYGSAYFNAVNRQ